jgi:hypothetical protein
MRFCSLLLAFLAITVMDLAAWPRRSRRREREPEPPAAVSAPAVEASPAPATAGEALAGAAAVTAAVTGAVFAAEVTPDIIINDLPRPPRLLVGRGETEQRHLAAFLLGENKNLDPALAETLAALYVAEAGAEGINHDIAFAQMCLETGFLRFGGLVDAGMNNFCGLGSTGPGVPGERFPTAELGVRAHIQHLQAYATDKPLAGELVDPRYRLVRRGSAPALQGLAGSWAADTLYAEKIEAILVRLYRSRDNPPEPDTRF